jgi:hypothetical protein
MATTYINKAVAATNAINKVMYTLYNAVGSTVVIRVYRILIAPISVATVTGGTGIYILDKFTGVPGGGAATTTIKMNTASAALNVSVTGLNGNTAISGTLTSLGVLRQYCRSNDEPTLATGAVTLQISALQTLYPMMTIWDSGYGEVNVEPITLRAGEGIRIYTTNAGTWGATTADIIAQFTQV